MKKTLAITLLSLLSLPAVAAVHLTPAGGSANGLSWSLGQLGSATFRSADGSTILTQGILQAPAVAYASISETGALPDPEISVDSDKITISSESGIEWTLYDSVGRSVAAGSDKIIRTKAFASGVYILKVKSADGNNIFKKILKR